MIDYIIIGIIVFSVIVSLLRGFVREVMSLASWIVAFFIASNFYVYLAGLLTSIESLYIRNGVAIAILFIASLIVGAIEYLVLASCYYVACSLWQQFYFSWIRSPRQIKVIGGKSQN